VKRRLPRHVRYADARQLDARRTANALALRRLERRQEFDAQVFRDESETCVPRRQAFDDVTPHARGQRHNDPHVGAVQHDLEIAARPEGEWVGRWHHEVRNDAVEGRESRYPPPYLGQKLRERE
jgi:hypothetical protein